MIKDIIKNILLIPLIPLIIAVAIKIWIETGGMTDEVPEEYVEQITKYHYLWLSLGGLFWLFIIFKYIIWHTYQEMTIEFVS